MAGIKILLVDDNKNKVTFFEPFADRVSNFLNAELVQAHTFEEMKSIFDESPYEYQALILDGKGQKTEKSKMEDDGFLTSSLKWLSLKIQEGVYIPYVVYSGYADELRKYYDEEPIYWKGKSEETDMLKFLKDKIEKSEYFKHRQLCPDVFELFDLKLLPSVYQPDLIKAAQVYYDTYSGNKVDVLRALRPMLEATFNELKNLDSSLISPKFFKSGNPNITGIIKYLAGSPKYNDQTETLEFHSDKVLPTHLYYITDALKNITSKAGIHHYDEASSKYLIKTCVNAFFEYALWYKKFAKDNYLK
jgi:hypothetical protein